MTDQELEAIGESVGLGPNISKEYGRALLSRAIPDGHVVVPGWLPIETYQKPVFDPENWWKSGERFLAASGGYVFVASYGYTEKGKGRFKNNLGICNPIYWMPLPAAPANKEG